MDNSTDPACRLWDSGLVGQGTSLESPRFPNVVFVMGSFLGGLFRGPGYRLNAKRCRGV